MSIRTNTYVQNNVFYAAFDCSPWDIGAHKASGTNRLGIWEGVKASETWYRIDNGPWISNGSSTNFTVSSGKNGSKIEACVRLEVWTMGKPGNDFPAFQFGKYENKIMWYKDTNEKWTQNMAAKPTQLRNDWKTVTGLDDSWKLSHIDWFPPNSDIYNGNWTYKHTLSKEPDYKYKTLWEHGAEYRNGNFGKPSEAQQCTKYGWKSVQGNLPQEYRKSQYFVFYKDFYTSVTSSGISTETGTPEIWANWSIGDSGSVSVRYKDPYNIKGKLQLKAVCNNKTHYITTFDSSPDYYNDWSNTYYINFNDVFGSSYRGHDVYYYVTGRNSYGSFSKEVYAGPQRYNQHPNNPSGAWLYISGRTLKLSWHATNDPDGDAISYCIYPYAYINNNWVRIDGSGKDYGHWTSATTMDINISNYAEGTYFKFQVWSYDGRLYSRQYSESNQDYIKYSVKQASLLYPRSEVCSTNPRIVFSVFETPDHTPVTTHVCWNGKWYDSSTDSQCFSVTGDATRYNHTQVFRPPTGVQKESSFVQFKTSNPSSSSILTSKTINQKVLPDNLAHVGEMISCYHLNELLSYIKAQANAYNVSGYNHYNYPQGAAVTSHHLNVLLNDIKTINNNINNYGYRVECYSDNIYQNTFVSANNINNVIRTLKGI